MKRMLLTLFAAIVLTVTLRAETFIVCVGVGNYADPKVENLAKTEGDAKTVAEFYRKATPNVVTITGKYATKTQILKTLREQFSRAKAGDKIVFYFSGHGYPGGFCPYEMTKISEGLKYSDVISIMQQSKATDKIIFADACHGGAVRQDGTSTDPRPGNVLLFMSSRGNETSLESPLMANGIFTKYLIRGLRGGADVDNDRRITARELFDFVSRQVKLQTDDKQHPVMWGNFDDDLTIVRYHKK